MCPVPTDVYASDDESCVYLTLCFSLSLIIHVSFVSTVLFSLLAFTSLSRFGSLYILINRKATRFNAAPNYRLPALFSLPTKTNHYYCSVLGCRRFMPCFSS